MYPKLMVIRTYAGERCFRTSAMILICKIAAAKNDTEL